MIEIQCFNEAYQHYFQNKINFRLLQDQAGVIFGLCRDLQPSFNSPMEITEVDIDWLLQQAEAFYNYVDYLGGNTYVCEIEDDLFQILGCDIDWANAHDGKWPNVTDIALSWDICDYLPEIKGNPHWVMFLMCWNNAGGPVYYVPKRLWTQAKVIDHVAATNPNNTN